MKKSLHYLTDDANWFPPVCSALDEPSGLLAVGGDLSTERLFAAYKHGVFPWYNEDEPLLWWSPDPRAVIIPNEIRINKSLKKFLRKTDYKVTINSAFLEVVKGCAKPRLDDGTWIFPEMIHAYHGLHKSGHAHSIEVWQPHEGQFKLVGGLYGVLVGGCFSGESMFSLRPNASKIALITLGKLMSSLKGALIDCQLANPYLMSMGAKTVSRDWFIEHLSNVANVQVPGELFASREIDV